MSDSRIIVALDFPDIEQARTLVKQLNPELCRLKIASMMFTRYGPAFVKELIDAGYSVFLDLKYHDIPNQVSAACCSAAELGVWMVNLHVSGGVAMMEAAVKALKAFPAKKRPLLIGVTVLTSMDASDLLPMGIEMPVDHLVLNYAKLAKESGLDGVVCSAQEAKVLRAELGKDFLLVTPGIRVASDKANDQKRIMTPVSAIEAGSSYLVVGRSITQAKDPSAALKDIVDSI